MSAYYNEIDPYAVEWLRNLIKAGHIADGEVDTRSIVNVSPDDLRGFDQCHFFAGIAGWSHALRLAGWADNRKIWTGSCPCQPFSVAGKGKGTDDERHLWPHFFRLIRGCRPPVVMGEQVAGAAGYGWIDGVRSDLESESYTIEGVDIAACSVNAPHIRQRLYWVAKEMGVSNCTGRDTRQQTTKTLGHRSSFVSRSNNSTSDLANAQSIGRRQGTEDIRGLSEGNRQEGTTRRFTVNNYSLNMANTNSGRCESTRERRSLDTIHARELHDRMPIAERNTCGIDMADADGEQLRSGYAGEPISPSCSNEGEAQQRERLWPDAGADGNPIANDMANAKSYNSRCEAKSSDNISSQANRSANRNSGCGGSSAFWHDAIWLNGADGKTRRAEPNICLLAHGVPARVGKLRAYGNAIVPPLAAEVIKAFMETGESHENT